MSLGVQVFRRAITVGRLKQRWNFTYSFKWHLFVFPLHEILVLGFIWVPCCVLWRWSLIIGCGIEFLENSSETGVWPLPDRFHENNNEMKLDKGPSFSDRKRIWHVDQCTLSQEDSQII